MATNEIQITLQQAERLGERWEFGLGPIWSDVSVLAERFWGTADSSDDASLSWHHLLMAVGNFKRQSPIRPNARVGIHGTQGTPRDSIKIPVIGPIRVDDVSSWQLLDDIPGVGVSTATALLSALWPDRHAIFDKLTAAAIVGLAAAEGRRHPILEAIDRGIDDTDDLGSLTFPQYEFYRSDILGWTHGPPSKIERALFELAKDKRLKVKKGVRRTWKQYGQVLVSVLESPESTA